MVAPTKVKRRFIAQQPGGQANGSSAATLFNDSDCEWINLHKEFSFLVRIREMDAYYAINM